ncbi:MAG: hypothetical protein HGGPFJEG_01528 [Ignavibacteria bacterium]|nr:hypothetical protein [Ignavibacteria bacterium]
MDGLEALIPLVAIVFTFGIPGILIFWGIYTGHREKMRLIEKGLPPDEVKAYFSKGNNKPKNPYSSLKWGILLTFVGAGIFLANLFESLYDIQEGVMMGIIVCSAGLGLLIFYLIMSSKSKNTLSESEGA